MIVVDMPLIVVNTMLLIAADTMLLICRSYNVLNYCNHQSRSFPEINLSKSFAINLKAPGVVDERKPCQI